MGAFSFLVAEAGIAPAPGGYEPPEVLLLHSAVKICSHTYMAAIMKLWSEDKPPGCTVPRTLQPTPPFRCE